MMNYPATLGVVRVAPYIHNRIWAPYTNVNPFARDIGFDEAVDSALTIGRDAKV